MFIPSNHAIYRSAQRSLPLEAVEYILEHGKVFHRAGALFYYLRDCDIPAYDRQYSQISRLAGTALVFSKDNQTLITIWRNQKDGLKHIRQKPRYSTSGSSSVLFV